MRIRSEVCIMNKAPALFVSHGAPTLALEPGVLGPKLSALGAHLTNLSAALVVSAHWQTAGGDTAGGRTGRVGVMRTAAPETVHDFGGFPPALYRLQYGAPGAPEMAGEAGALLEQAGFPVEFDDRRGIDHGVWVPLRYLLPRAEVPVFQVSLPFGIDARGAVRLGEALAPMRERGVMIMGSGSLTHNLGEIEPPGSSAEPYALEFAAWVRRRVQQRDLASLVDYRRLAPHAVRAHPTEEHFVPLLVAMGTGNGADSVTIVEGGTTYGVLSMESYAFGLVA
jgi:4,5-DOPA dioxygenase extradiol